MLNIYAELEGRFSCQLPTELPVRKTQNRKYPIIALALFILLTLVPFVLAFGRFSFL